MWLRRRRRKEKEATEGEGGSGCRAKNKNPTQRCGEKSLKFLCAQSNFQYFLKLVDTCAPASRTCDTCGGFINNTSASKCNL